jgi:hypothetical protein
MRSLSSPTSLPHRRLQRSLDFLSSRIPDPVNKLWFIKRTLSEFDRRPESLKRLAFVRTLLFYYVALESLGELVWSPRAGLVSLPRGPLWTAYRLRHVIVILIACSVGYGSYRLGTIGYEKAQIGADWLFAQILPTSASADALPAPDYPTQRMSQPPREVWLVKQDGDEELWSNGLRVVTSFETKGEPREFLAFPRDGSPPVPMDDRPVGIVYHASQSDMAPFAREFNRNILSTTLDLIGWLSRREIYNYVIDRFGQVYRVVSDDTVAVHAGVPIWADEDYYYLNLNESFVGVAFETQWSPGGELVTPAQLQAAVNLTDLLRSRYDISDINCVPHGLVSVNAQKKLIGYHADWARNFPFGALGLSNNYLVPPPSIVDFGFRYDEDLEARLGGELWAGVATAEQELERRAEEQGLDVSELRSRLQHNYRDKLELVKLSASAKRRDAAQGTTGSSQ